MNVPRAHRVVLIIGYGNPLRADDGAGPAAIEQLRDRASSDRRRHTFRLVSEQQLLPEMALDVAAARLTLFVDASIDQPPGSVRFRRVQPAAEVRFASLGHRWTAADIVGLACPLAQRAPRAWACTIGAASLDYRIGLSSEVTAAVDGLVRRLSRS